MPELYRDRILAVTGAFASTDPGVLSKAALVAELLDQEMTTEYGERDVRTVSIREMRGWLAHLTGQHSEATRWYLHTTGLLAAVCGTTAQLTRGSARRAVITWLAIPDSTAAAALAQEVWATTVAAEGETSPSAHAVAHRLQQLRRVA